MVLHWVHSLNYNYSFTSRGFKCIFYGWRKDWNIISLWHFSYDTPSVIEVVWLAKYFWLCWCMEVRNYNLLCCGSIQTIIIIKRKCQYYIVWGAGLSTGGVATDVTVVQVRVPRRERPKKVFNKWKHIFKYAMKGVIKSTPTRNDDNSTNYVLFIYSQFLAKEL